MATDPDGIFDMVVPEKKPESRIIQSNGAPVSPPPNESEIIHLDETEIKMLELFREGLTKPKIAERLDVSVQSVRKFLSSENAEAALADRDAEEREAVVNKINSTAVKALKVLEDVLDDEATGKSTRAKVAIEYLRATEYFKTNDPKVTVNQNEININGKSVRDIPLDELEAEVNKEARALAALTGGNKAQEN